MRSTGLPGHGDRILSTTCPLPSSAPPGCDWHSAGSAEPACSVGLRQRTADDGARGLHQVQAGDLQRRWLGRRRLNRAVPTQLHAGIPRPHPACAHRIAAPTLTPPAEELSVRTCLRVTVDERPRVLVLRDSHWTLWTSSRHRVQTVQY